MTIIFIAAATANRYALSPKLPTMSTVPLESIVYMYPPPKEINEIDEANSLIVMVSTRALVVFQLLLAFFSLVILG